MAFELPDLPYDYDALEPYIDGRTMEIHYEKHHNAYLTKFKKAIEGTELEDQDLETILSKAGQHGPGVRNQGGGYFNHILFWDSMSPSGGGKPTEQLSYYLDLVEVSLWHQICSKAGSFFAALTKLQKLYQK